MKSSILFGFTAVLGAAFLTIGIVALVGLLTSRFIFYPLYWFLLIGTIFVWVGLWGLGIEYFELINNQIKLSEAYVLGFLGIVLVIVGVLVLYMYTSGFFPAF